MKKQYNKHDLSKSPVFHLHHTAHLDMVTEIQMAVHDSFILKY